MNNFIFENKTKVYFGKGGVKEYLGSLLGNYGETVMLAYGGGSHRGVLRYHVEPHLCQGAGGREAGA